MMQAAPGGVQMPQLALQQCWPGGQTVLPHTSPFGTQAISGQAPPREEQMPQRGSQQTVPGLQTVSPHGSPGGTQAIAGQAPPRDEQMPQVASQQKVPGSQTFLPHGSPGGGQATMMQAAPIGAQALQLGLQQYSPLPHTLSPQRSGGSGGQTPSVGQSLPTGAQVPQLGLQQYSPGGQTDLPHTCGAHFTLRHGTPVGRQMPPQRLQQRVPALQRMWAQGFSFCTQTPPQSAPPLAGSQSSRGSSTQTNPPGHGTPAIPPQKRPAGFEPSPTPSCLRLRRLPRPRASAVTAGAAMAATTAAASRPAPRRSARWEPIRARRSMRLDSKPATAHLLSGEASRRLAEWSIRLLGALFYQAPPPLWQSCRFSLAANTRAPRDGVVMPRWSAGYRGRFPATSSRGGRAIPSPEASLHIVALADGRTAAGTPTAVAVVFGRGAAAPPDRRTDMDGVPMEGRGVRVRAYFGERDRQHGRPLWSVLLEFLRHEHVAGATVTRGLAGYGANSKIHAASIVDLSSDLPLVLEWVDREETVQRLMPRFEAMLQGGLITTDPVTIIRYQPHADGRA